jgi:hypothetical protein
MTRHLLQYIATNEHVANMLTKLLSEYKKYYFNIIKHIKIIINI